MESAEFTNEMRWISKWKVLDTQIKTAEYETKSAECQIEIAKYWIKKSAEYTFVVKTYHRKIAENILENAE